MKIHLGGSLAWHDAQRRTQFEVVLEETISLRTLLERLSIPVAEVALTVVNGEMAESLEALVGDRDDVRFYPIMGGG